MQRKTGAQQLQLEGVIPEPQQGNGLLHRSDTDVESRAGRAHYVPTTNGDSLQESTHRASRPSPGELLETPGALLTRSHLRGLGLERRAIDAVFRALPVIALPGYSRPMVRAEQFLELVDHCTYRDDRMRPCHA